MGQSAHPGRSAPRGVAAGAAAAVAAAVTLTGCGGSLASATTTVDGVIGATVVHSDGRAVVAVDGLRLRPGDVVRTGPGGRAELVTRSRHVFVGSDASVQVVDGAHQQLRHGAVVVDAQHGPSLSMQVAGLDVTTPSGAATRAERAVTVRVGALAADTHILSATGRALTVPALRQVMVGGDALPDTTTPLRLTDDDGEAHAVPDLVRDDQALVALARGIDESGARTARVVTAAWHQSVVPTPPGVARSESVLPVVIAAAGPARDAQQNYLSAVALRSAGGSWGVVAHLLGVRASGVVDALASLERSQPGGAIGDVRAILAALGISPPGGGSVDGGPRGHGGGGGSASGGGNSGGGGGGQTPTPSPTPGPVGQVVTTVDDTVGQVLSLLPTPTPTPSGLLPSDLTSPLPLPGIP